MTVAKDSEDSDDSDDEGNPPEKRQLLDAATAAFVAQFKPPPAAIAKERKVDLYPVLIRIWLISPVFIFNILPTFRRGSPNSQHQHFGRAVSTVWVSLTCTQESYCTASPSESDRAG